MAGLEDVGHREAQGGAELFAHAATELAKTEALLAPLQLQAGEARVALVVQLAAGPRRQQGLEIVVE